MANKSPEQVAEKYQRRLSQSGQDYIAGVQNPSSDWAQATIKGQQRWETGIQQAMAAGAFQAGVQRTGSQKWQANALGKGAQRFQGASAEAAQAYQQQVGNIMSAAQAAKQAAGAQPNATMEQRLERSRAANVATSNFWKQRRGVRA